MQSWSFMGRTEGFKTPIAMAMIPSRQGIRYDERPLGYYVRQKALLWHSYKAKI
jgi:hypothetical protein